MREADRDQFLATQVLSAILLREYRFDFIRERAGRLPGLFEQATGLTVAGRNAEYMVHAFDGPLQASAEALQAASNS